MKKTGLTPLFIVLIVCLGFSTSFLQVSFAAEKWESNMRKDFAKVLQEKKKPAEKHRELILKWQKQGRLSALLTLYTAREKNRQAQQPSTPTIKAAFYYGLGYLHALQATETGEVSETAINYLQYAVEINPALFWARFNLGGIYQDQGKDELALAEFEACIRLNAKYYPVLYRMGEIHLKQQNYIEALQAFDAARKANRKWEYPQYGIGLVYFAQGEIDRARETFENLTHQKKRFAPAYFKLGQILATEGFFDEALEEYAKGSKYQDYSAQILYELAVIFDEKGNTDGAIRLYQRTIEVDPTHAKTHFALGERLYTSGDTTTAVQHYQQAVSLTPNIKDAFYEPLEPYFAGLMTPDEARLSLEKAMRVLPDDPRAHFYTGMVEADAGNIQKAIEAYEKTVEIIEVSDPSLTETELLLGDFNDVYLKLGELHHQQGNADTAVVYFKRALALNPELANKFITQGQRAFDAENYQEAIESLNTHLLLFPEDVDAAYLLGQSYEVNGDTDNALILYQRTFDVRFTANRCTLQDGSHLSKPRSTSAGN